MFPCIARTRSVNINEKYRKREPEILVKSRPLMLSVTGAHSGAGKTGLACTILELCRGRFGAIKYTKTPFYTSVTEAAVVEGIENKDTSRLIKSGAAKVLWIESPPGSALEEALSMAVCELIPEDGLLDGIIVEGNSPSLIMDFDLRFFVAGDNTKNMKKSAINALNKADFIVFNTDKDIGEISQSFSSELDLTKKHCVLSLYNIQDENKKDGSHDACLEAILDEIEKKKIEIKLEGMSGDGRISCAVARRIAEELNVDYKDVGDTANRLKIKIRDCELGCF